MTGGEGSGDELPSKGRRFGSGNYGGAGHGWKDAQLMVLWNSSSGYNTGLEGEAVLRRS